MKALSLPLAFLDLSDSRVFLLGWRFFEALSSKGCLNNPTKKDMTGELERLGRNLRIQAVLPQLNPHTELGRNSILGYAKRAGEDPAEFVKKRFGEHPLSPEKAGTEMARLLTDEELTKQPELLLTGAGWKTIP